MSYPGAYVNPTHWGFLYKYEKIAIIRTALRDQPRYLRRALMEVYGMQTSDEKSSEVTRHVNGVGFTLADASTLTEIAKLFQAGGKLTSDDWRELKTRMQKYAGQLLRLGCLPED